MIRNYKCNLYTHRIRLELIVLVIAFFLFNTVIVSAGSFLTSSSIENSDGCEYRWFCSDWNPVDCPENQIQTRKCTNAGDCADDYERPKEKRSCRYFLSPEHLFDIELGLQRNTIQSVYELTAWVTFENFGTRPTLVNLTFSVLDERDIELYTKEDHLVVETEKYVTEGFPGLDLEPGEYTLVLKTLYDTDVEDEFRQEFTLEREREPPSLIFILVISLVVIIFVIGTLIVRGRKSKEKNKSMMKKQARRSRK